MAKKTLITEAQVRTAAAAGSSTLAVPTGALITPLARDTARELGVALVAEAAAPPEKTPAVTRPRTHTLVLGSDHGGFRMKEDLKPLLQELGWKVLDVGTSSEQSCDYPDFAFAVARAVALGKADVGIMIDGAGLGSAMVCNKVPSVRAACAYNEFTAWNARAHNNANVLTLGSRTLGIEVVKRIVQTFLGTDFEGGRHAARVDKISDVEARFAPAPVR